MRARLLTQTFMHSLLTMLTLTLFAAASRSLMLSRQWPLNRGGSKGNGDSDNFRGLYHAWGLGNRHFIDASKGPDRCARRHDALKRQKACNCLRLRACRHALHSPL